jgi:prefoldin subunit 5
LLANKGQLKGKIPDILQSLDAVRLLKSTQDSEEGVVSNFQLCESLYATARIKRQQHIGLWLGANVMMEYTLDEAEDLLTSNLATAQASLIEVDTGLSFCREQLTTTEVNIARVYNYDVQQRRQVTHPASRDFEPLFTFLCRQILKWLCNYSLEKSPKSGFVIRMYE